MQGCPSGCCGWSGLDCGLVGGSGRGRVDAILRNSGGSSGLRCAARRAVALAKADRSYGGCSSGVERWTVAPEAAGSKPVIHPNFLATRALSGVAAALRARERYSTEAFSLGWHSRAGLRPFLPSASVPTLNESLAARWRTRSRHRRHAGHRPRRGAGAARARRVGGHRRARSRGSRPAADAGARRGPAHADRHRPRDRGRPRRADRRHPGRLGRARHPRQQRRHQRPPALARGHRRRLPAHPRHQRDVRVGSLARAASAARGVGARRDRQRRHRSPARCRWARAPSTR